jgi:hypothetical protein
MEALDFVYWLQGFAELSEAPPTPEQWKSIKEHIGLVLKKETPPAPGTEPWHNTYVPPPIIARCVSDAKVTC